MGKRARVLGVGGGDFQLDMAQFSFDDLVDYFQLGIKLTLSISRDLHRGREFRFARDRASAPGRGTLSGVP